MRPGEVCALFGSTDHLEIAINGGSAGEMMALSRGAAIEITRREEP
jgi:S-adenosylmethionine hydrolase